MTISKHKLPYSPLEERWNVFSHATGIALSVVAFILLLLKAASYGDWLHYLAYSVYGCSLIVLYTASTTYHNAKDPKHRKRLKVFDHSAIYVLIAGSATPILLISLQALNGMFYLALLWGMALLGILFKLFFTGRFKVVSTLSYIVQGWVLVIAFVPIYHLLSPDMLHYIFLGGLAYSIGAVLYMIKKIPFNHAIFHLFCLAGSFFHFVAVYKYV